MFLKCAGSGSSGNTYILENSDEILILDAGVSFKKVVKPLIDFNVSKIVGLCITHEHGDHYEFAKDYRNAGIPVFEPFRNDQLIKISRQMGGFKVTSFKVPHDGTPCCGFLIEHSDIGKLLYVTDLEYCPYDFSKQKINHILVESNYDMQFVDKSFPNYEHIIRGHMSLDTCKEFVRTNNTDSLKNVILCHLSTKNSDKAYFINEVQKMAKNAQISACERYYETELN